MTIDDDGINERDFSFDDLSDDDDNSNVNALATQSGKNYYGGYT